MAYLQESSPLNYFKIDDMDDISYVQKWVEILAPKYHQPEFSLPPNFLDKMTVLEEKVASICEWMQTIEATIDSLQNLQNINDWMQTINNAVASIQNNLAQLNFLTQNPNTGNIELPPDLTPQVIALQNAVQLIHTTLSNIALQNNATNAVLSTAFGEALW